jgi:hypothetical protein
MAQTFPPPEKAQKCNLPAGERKGATLKMDALEVESRNIGT